jgi:hypothetical protein
LFLPADESGCAAAAANLSTFYVLEAPGKVSSQKEVDLKVLAAHVIFVGLGAAAGGEERGGEVLRRKLALSQADQEGPNL